MDDYTEHIDGVMARVESKWPTRPTEAFIGPPLPFRIGSIHVSANNGEELVAALIEYAKTHRGLGIPSGPRDQSEGDI